MDESMFFKAKYNRGRQLVRPQIWVWGAIERGTNNVIMIPIQQRDAGSLMRLIVDVIRPGTELISDGWAAYGGINALQAQLQIHHRWVNHRYNFVDPQDRQVHTQSIEATWGALKRSLKHLMGTSEQLFPTYLYQYMFRRAHNNQLILENLLYWIVQYYPVHS